MSKLRCEKCGLDHPEVFINKKIWDTFDDGVAEGPETNRFKQAVFDHYRATGYPQYVFTDAEKLKELNKLTKFDHSTLLKGDTITQSMHGLGLAWSYHPHHISVECGGLRTVEATWNDDALLKKVIEKRIRWGTYISDSGLRKSVRSYSGTQAVSNFRPSAAAAIYHQLLPADGGVVWDMSMGWGGRLLGAFSCHRVKKYIGCDPATQTFIGLKQMEADIQRFVPERQLETSLHMLGSETQEIRNALPKGEVDLCWTSTPYFNCEKYSNESTQSWVKYKTKNAWLTEFIGGTLDNCAYCLKPNGVLAVNIAAVDSYKEIEKDFLDFAKNKGWYYVKTVKLALSRMMGTRKKQTETHKYEPIFILGKSNSNSF